MKNLIDFWWQGQSSGSTWGDLWDLVDAIQTIINNFYPITFKLYTKFIHSGRDDLGHRDNEQGQN